MDEDSIFRHKDERKVRTLEDDASSVAESSTTTDANDQELDIGDSDNDSEHEEDKHSSDSKQETCDKLDAIHEEDKNAKSESDNVERTYTETDLKGQETLDEQSKDTGDADMDIDKPTEETNKQESKDSSSSDEGESLFPDTSIQLQHVKGDK